MLCALASHDDTVDAVLGICHLHYHLSYDIDETWHAESTCVQEWCNWLAPMQCI